jgi:hypothetical protein
MPIRQPHFLASLLTKDDVELGKAEGERVVLVNQRHLDVAG